MAAADSDEGAGSCFAVAEALLLNGTDEPDP
jgi:hypothetical protein